MKTKTYNLIIINQFNQIEVTNTRINKRVGERSNNLIKKYIFKINVLNFFCLFCFLCFNQIKHHFQQATWTALFGPSEHFCNTLSWQVDPYYRPASVTLWATQRNQNCGHQVDHWLKFKVGIREQTDWLCRWPKEKISSGWQLCEGKCLVAGGQNGQTGADSIERPRWLKWALVKTKECRTTSLTTQHLQPWSSVLDRS